MTCENIDLSTMTDHELDVAAEHHADRALELGRNEGIPLELAERERRRVLDIMTIQGKRISPAFGDAIRNFLKNGWREADE